MSSKVKSSPAPTFDLGRALASAGTQRVITLGGAGAMVAGMSHDGFFPLHRMVRWINDEG
jgi:predicted Rossmann-fold nucleotide-binding protein